MSETTEDKPTTDPAGRAMSDLLGNDAGGITEDQAYIAVRKDGFVDGACFTQSEDSDDWCKEMKAAGMAIEVRDRKEAKQILFTHIARDGNLVA